MGFPTPLIRLIRDIYTDATTSICTSKDDYTEPITIGAGIKQGCPMSAILFNLTSELILRSVLSTANEDPSCHGQKISVLAYADDIVLTSRTSQGLQSFLNAATAAANILSLSFRQDKCATLSLTCGSTAQSRVADTVFNIQDIPNPILQHNDSYLYLGIPIGLLYNSSDMTDKLINHLDKIRDSLLAPWQKLDAIRTFIQPCLTYAFQSCPVTQTAAPNSSASYDPSATCPREQLPPTSLPPKPPEVLAYKTHLMKNTSKPLSRISRCSNLPTHSSMP